MSPELPSKNNQVDATVPFESRPVPGGSSIYRVKPSIKAYGMTIQNGKPILFAETHDISVEDQPMHSVPSSNDELAQRGLKKYVEERGAWVYVSDKLNSKVVGDKSQQMEAIEEYRGIPQASLGRQLMDTYRRWRLIRRLPKGLRPHNFS